MTPTIDIEAARAAFEAAQGEVTAAGKALTLARQAAFDAQLDYDVKVELRDAAATVLLNAIAASLMPPGSG